MLVYTAMSYRTFHASQITHLIQLSLTLLCADLDHTFPEVALMRWSMEEECCFGVPVRQTLRKSVRAKVNLTSSLVA